MVLASQLRYATQAALGGIGSLKTVLSAYSALGIIQPTPRMWWCPKKYAARKNQAASRQRIV